MTKKSILFSFLLFTSFQLISQPVSHFEIDIVNSKKHDVKYITEKITEIELKGTVNYSDYSIWDLMISDKYIYVIVARNGGSDYKLLLFNENRHFLKEILTLSDGIPRFISDQKSPDIYIHSGNKVIHYDPEKNLQKEYYFEDDDKSIMSLLYHDKLFWGISVKIANDSSYEYEFFCSNNPSLREKTPLYSYSYTQSDNLRAFPYARFSLAVNNLYLGFGFENKIYTVSDRGFSSVTTYNFKNSKPSPEWQYFGWQGRIGNYICIMLKDFNNLFFYDVRNGESFILQQDKKISIRFCNIEDHIYYTENSKREKGLPIIYLIKLK